MRIRLPMKLLLTGGLIMLAAIKAAALLFKACRVKTLAVTSTMRSPQQLDVPTMVEQSLPGYEASTRFGLLIPAKTPKDMVDFLRTAIEKVMEGKDVQKRFADASIEMSTVETGRYTVRARMETDHAKWGKLIRETGVKPN
jgi:tripartite-type tricarboxylate transporter receptor subunit TctC